MRLRGQRVRLATFLVGMLGLAVLVVFVAAALAPRQGRLPSRDDVARFEAAITAPLHRGGQVVELGLKVGLGDLGSEHRTAPSVIAEQARAWAADLRGIRADVAGAEAAQALEGVQRAFVESVDAYTEAAELIRRAALADGAERENLLDEAAAAGSRADSRYDDAAARLQAIRRSLGLPPNPDFPNPHGGAL